METWYGIQIALLHPDVKTVFSKPQVTVEKDVIGKQSKKRKVKYIRKHVVKLEDLEDAACGGQKTGINRKCLAWYVVGHWRTYKNGKKIFIMPYWKGVLRNLKQNIDGDERDREINISWDTSIRAASGGE